LLVPSGGASAVKEPGHFEVRKSLSPRVRGIARILSGGAVISSRKLTTILVVALKTQAANAADCFTVKIKQIKWSYMVTFLFSVHTITEAKQ